MEQPNKFQFQRISLSNGLILLISENRRVPLISMSGFVLAGSDQNPIDRPGLACMTASLLDEGTENYDDQQIAALIENSGGDITVFSQRELSGISLEMKSEDLSLGLELLAEMLRRPVFPEKRFRLEQEKVLNQLQAMDDNPQTVAGKLFNRWIYRGSPLEYPILGTQESMREVPLEEIRHYHRRNYAAQNAVLVVVGAAHPKQVMESVQRGFADWQNPEYGRTEMPPLQRQTEPIFEEYFVEKEQVNILMGHLGIVRTNPDYYALQVMDVILGSGPGLTSRIPRKLRDEGGLAYSTYADFSGSSGLYPGRFIAYVSTSPEHRERAIQEVLDEIRDMGEEGITSQELEAAQDYLSGNFVFELQSNSAVARFLLGCELFGLGEDYGVRYAEIIRAVTRDQVNQVARQYLDTINYTTVVVGPTH